MNPAGQMNDGYAVNPPTAKDRNGDQGYSRDECGSSQEEAQFGTTPIAPNTGAGSLDPTTRSFS